MKGATLLLIFLLTTFSGSEDDHILQKITVQKGQTVIIPCLYDPNFVDSRKYFCSGLHWVISYPVEHERISILDYKTEHFFTVTLRNVEDGDNGKYWCAVDIPGYDRGTPLYLEVLEDNPRLHISSQNMTGYEGGSITIHCPGASIWCKIGRQCAADKTSETKVDIRGEVLNVTLRGLQREDAGWYFCSDGESQMPVYISVGMASNLNETSDIPLNASAQGHFLWLVILGVILPILICGVVILLKLKKRKPAAASGQYECLNRAQLPQGSSPGVACEDAYEVMSNIQHKGMTCKQGLKEVELWKNNSYKRWMTEPVFNSSQWPIKICLHYDLL